MTSPSPARRLLRYLRPVRGLLLLATVATILASLFDGLTLVLLSPLLDALFGTGVGTGMAPSRLQPILAPVLGPLQAAAGPGGAAAAIVLVLLAALVAKNAMLVVSDQLTTAAEEGLVRDLRIDLFGHLLRADLSLLQQTRGGHLTSALMADTDQARRVVAAVLAALLRNSVIILVTLAILAGLSGRLTLLTLTAAPLLLLLVRGLLRRVRRHAAEWATLRADLTGTVIERLAAIKLIRVTGSEAAEEERFRDQASRYRKRVIRTQRFAVMTSPVSEVFGGVVIILVIWASRVPGLTGAALAPADTILFLVAALKMLSPLKSLMQFPTQMATALAGAERVFALLDTTPGETDAPEAGEATFREGIAFDRVSVRHGDGPLVLDQVSLTVPRGAVVAIVGPSGAGKTTLLELLPRFVDPVAGEVRLDGVPLTRLTRSSLRRLLGVVSQDPVLLHDTVHANIAYGRPEATRAEVATAADAANAAPFIGRLPAGYDTVLGERGTRLSGGERQRIAIARALLRDPPILILDEATSALDAAAEQLVQQAIARLMRGRTVLVIAHRLATVRHADQIVVLDGGRVVDQGTHEALLSRDGLYRRLHDLHHLSPGADS